MCDEGCRERILVAAGHRGTACCSSPFPCAGPTASCRLVCLISSAPIIHLPAIGDRRGGYRRSFP
jgi:hypothetical protein